MKILLIMGGFFPGKKYGGPPVSADNFCTLMKGNANCYIVTRNHDKSENISYRDIKEGWNNRGNAQVMYLSDVEFGEKKFEEVVNDLKPNYIYLQGLFQECVYPSLKIARKYRIKVVLAPRGELCAGAFKKKRYKKLLYILALRLMGLFKDVAFQSTSDEETDAISHFIGVPIKKIYLLSNIPSIPHNLPDHEEKVSGVGRFVFISRILWKKNLLKAISYFKKVKGKAIFDIYGPKEDEGYWNECERAIKQLPLNVSVNYKGVLSHEEIHKTFRQYDAFLFPTLSENYGHVIAEALVTGCIPIISDQTPWTDMNEAGAGWALPLDSETKIIDAIQGVIDMDEKRILTQRKAISSYLEGKLQIEELKRQYIAVFK